MKKRRQSKIKLIKKLTTSLVLTLAITATALFTPLMPQATIEAEAASYDMSIDMHCEPAWEVLDIVNQERAKAGVEPLQMDGALMATAYVRANELVQFYSHTRPNGEDAFTAFPLTKGKARGENIAAGQLTAAEVMNSWMNSTGHRRNILNSKYKAIGIYEVYVPGSQWEHYWVQCFRDVLEDPILPGGAPKNAVTTKDGSIPMYRLYNPYTGEHFYTANHSETVSVCAAGWNYEGIAWYAPANGTPVYRLYNPNAGDHHYTLDASERDHLISVGWNYEGVSWNSGGQTPLYRAYNPNAFSGAHHYTTDAAEISSICAAGWNNEGVGWYGIR